MIVMLGALKKQGVLGCIYIYIYIYIYIQGMCSLIFLFFGEKEVGEVEVVGDAGGAARENKLLRDLGLGFQEM